MSLFPGSSSSWPYGFLVIAALHVPVIFVSCYIPDTPSWLVVNDRQPEALSSISYYYGSDDLMEEIKRDSQLALDQKKMSKGHWWKEYVLLLSLWPLRHPVLISLMIFCSTNLVGISRITGVFR